MADWKQITARIRRARSGKDPAAQLSTLFEKTRDAMVAFELARFFETSGQNSDAAKWYVTAAERFRRADWKAKAQEAAVRLGAEVAAASASDSSAADQSSAVDVPPAEQVPAVEPSADSSASRERVSPLEETATAAGTDSDAPAERKRRRRGKRGGRNRRKV